MYLGTYGIDEYVAIPAVTHRFSSGAAYAPTAITYSIYEEGNTTGLDEDVDMTPASPFDSVTGLYYARRQLTAAAGFEANKTYVVVVKATVDSVAALDVHVFQIRPQQTGDSYAIVNHADYGNAKLVRSTTPANTLTVDASHLVDITQAAADKAWSTAARTLTAIDEDNTTLDLDATIEAILAASATIAALPTATENADALLDRDMSAVSESNARSPLNALRFLRNKWSISGSTLTVTKENDSTAAWTSTLTTDGAADPVTASDPA